MAPTQKLDADTVRDLFVASHGLAVDSETERVAALMARYPKEVDPFRTIPKALVELRRIVPEFHKTLAFGSMWHHSSLRLLERSATPPQAPRDERIEASINCRCKDCDDLRNFCLDPAAKSMQFRAAQQVRAHIEGSIRMATVDIECHTESYGRPYTLVCVKVPKSYRRRVEVHAADVKQMRLLAKAVPSNDSPEVARTLARLHEALVWK